MKKILSLLFMLLVAQVIFATVPEEIKIDRYTQRIVVHGIDKGFTRYISIEGKSSSKGYIIPTAIDQENDSLSDFSLYYKKKKYKKVKNAALIDSPDFNNFHNSRVVKVLEVDSGKTFRCNFTISCKNLMLLSSIDLSSVYKTDTAIYQLSIPTSLSICYDSLHFDLLPFHTISSMVNSDTLHLTVTAKPAVYTSEDAYPKFPVMRMIIVPKSFEKKETRYFTNWFMSRIEKITHLSEGSKKIIDSIATTSSSSGDTIACYYNFIRSRFKYLDVQVGLGAFIPRDVNTIVANRQGDCKDMSTLLYSILRDKGYDARLAIAATYNHSCDADFPSLHSGDHMICVVKKDSSFILLDPTDVNHTIGEPVMSLQGKTILIMDEESPVYYKVPVRPASENQFAIRLNLKATANKLEGGFTITTTGYINDDYQQISSTQGNKDLQKALTYSANDIFQKQAIESLTKVIRGDTITMTGTIAYANKYYADNNLIYLFADFIPVIYDNYVHVRKLSEEAFLGSTMDKQVEMTIAFDKEIKKIDFTPLILDTCGHQLTYTVTQKNPNTISIAYHFVSNALWLRKEDIDPINQLIDNFNTKLNETIVLHY
jgi:hypothetical protein